MAQSSSTNPAPRIEAADRALWRVRLSRGLPPDLVRTLDEIPSLPYETIHDAYQFVIQNLGRPAMRYLAALDRYFLLIYVLGRLDIIEGQTDYGAKWLYERCREVERAPDGFLDLWARDHYKSTFITFGGLIQEVIRDPEVTICIFSFDRPLAKDFLRQIMQELETNVELKALYPEIFYQDPRREARKWSEDDGITVKRTRNPKENTIEAAGLVDAQPVGKHFDILNYEDIVNHKAVTGPEMIQKVTDSYRNSDNIGKKTARKRVVGTRWSFADSYGALIDDGTLIPRIYPATKTGTPHGQPILLTPEQLAKKRKDQGNQFGAQMLLNPGQSEDAMFKAAWLRRFWIRPHTLHVYILVDPSKGRNRRSDRTGVAVIAVDANENKYLIDGAVHRMNLNQRYALVKELYRKWHRAPGVQHCLIGYEEYGMQTDLEHFDTMTRLEKIDLPIEEVAWPNDGKYSKEDRVGRLQPDFENSRFYLPAVVQQPGGKLSTWEVELVEEKGPDGKTLWVPGHRVIYKPLAGEPKQWSQAIRDGNPHRKVGPIRRLDEEKKLYDVTARFIEEYLYFPFSQRKDLIDASSRIYDLEPTGPLIVDPSGADPNVYVDS